MTGLSVEDYMALDKALAAVFEAEQDCESTEHFKRPDGHAGTAEWYLHVKHDACGYNAVRAFCDKFKRLIMLPDSIAICSGCLVELNAREVIRSAIKIGS